MPIVKLYKNEVDSELIEVESIAKWYIDNKNLWHEGYHLFESSVSQDKDITLDRLAIENATDVIALKPAAGGIGDVIAGAANIIVGATLLAVEAISTIVGYLAPSVSTSYSASSTGSTASTSSTSSTNSLGSRENTPNIAGRSDDIWGTVAKHTPRLIGYPLLEFEDNVEVEVFPLYISDGKVQMSNVREGDTPLSSMAGAKFNAWYEGNPNDGDTPDYTIGGEIGKDMHVVKYSSELSEEELLPPNDLALGTAAVWSIVGNGDGTATLTLTNYSALDIDLADYFTVSGTCSLIDAFISYSDGTQLLYDDVATEYTFNKNVLNLSGDYTISNVTTNTVTLSGISQTFSSTSFLTSSFFTVSNSQIDTFYTTDSAINDITYYSDNLAAYPVTVVSGSYTADVGQSLSNILGPITIYKDTETASFNFVASSGFYKYVNTTLKAVTATIRVTIQETDSDGVATGNSFSNDYTFASNTSSTTKQAALTVKIEIPYAYSRALCQRITNRDTSDGVTAIDKVYWRDLFFLSTPENIDTNDCTIAMVEIPSSVAARAESNRLINLTCTRIFTPYIGDGLFDTEQAVSTWAEVMIGLCLDKYNGRLSIEHVDADLLLDIQDQLTTYYGTSDFVQIGYDLDDNTLTFQDVYTLFCSAVLVKPYSQGGVFKAYADIDRTISSKQFTHRNKISQSDSRERDYQKEYDGISLTYRSNDTGNSETIELYLDGISGTNLDQITLSAAVNETQATIQAYRALNILKYKRDTFSFKADGVAHLTVTGERVDNVDYSRIVYREGFTDDSGLGDLNKYRIYSGFVEDADGLTLTLSEPVFFRDDETHTIRLTAKNGDLLEAIECQPGLTSYHVILDETPSQEIYVGYEMEKTTYTLAPDLDRDAMPMVIQTLTSGTDNGTKIKTITGYNYDSRYYQNDKDFAV